jgi:hypothetical protein
MAFSKKSDKKTEKKPETKAAPAKGKQEYDDNNKGALFVNDKDGNDARPDFTGRLVLRADDYTLGENGTIIVRLAAWQRTSEKCGEYLSLAASDMLTTGKDKK